MRHRVTVPESSGIETASSWQDQVHPELQSQLLWAYLGSDVAVDQLSGLYPLVDL